jgi:hypothetical protein
MLNELCDLTSSSLLILSAVLGNLFTDILDFQARTKRLRFLNFFRTWGGIRHPNRVIVQDVSKRALQL